MNHLDHKSSAPDIDQVSSSDGEREAYALGRACASRLSIDSCAVILRDLEHAIAGMLVNAQVMEWKLPPYSHAKRYVREIERNAQRSAELVKQVMRKLAIVDERQQVCEEVPDFTGAMAAVTAQEPNVKEPSLARPANGRFHACGS
jgi:hypothetical protein